VFVEHATASVVPETSLRQSEKFNSFKHGKVLLHEYVGDPTSPLDLFRRYLTTCRFARYQLKLTTDPVHVTLYKFNYCHCQNVTRLSSTYERFVRRIIVKMKECNFRSHCSPISRSSSSTPPKRRAHLLSATLLRDRLDTPAQRIRTIDNAADHVRHFRHSGCSSLL